MISEVDGWPKIQSLYLEKILKINTSNAQVYAIKTMTKFGLEMDLKGIFVDKEENQIWLSIIEHGPQRGDEIIFIRS